MVKKCASCDWTTDLPPGHDYNAYVSHRIEEHSEDHTHLPCCCGSGHGPGCHPMRAIDVEDAQGAGT